MPRTALGIGCLAAGVAAGAIAGIAGLDPVTAGLVGFGTAGLLFVFLSGRRRPGS